MMAIASIILLSLFSISIHYWPEYSVVWAIVNTIAYIANIKKHSYVRLEDIWASIIGWFIAPILYFIGV